MMLKPQPPARMTSDEFLAWASEHDVGRVELIEGEVVAMAGCTRGHTRYKANIRDCLRAALADNPSPCEPYVDGLAVKISDTTTYIPDVVVDCAQDQEDDDLLCRDPLIVVEVLSQSTARKDTDIKLMDYFRVKSVAHYLIVNAHARRVIHHRRRDDDSFNTRILTAGAIDLTPPGITIQIEDFWRGLPAPRPLRDTNA